MPKPLDHYTSLARDARRRRSGSTVQQWRELQRAHVHTDAPLLAMARWPSSDRAAPVPSWRTRKPSSSPDGTRPTARPSIDRTILLAVRPHDVSAHPRPHPHSAVGLVTRHRVASRPPESATGTTDVMLETILTVDGIDWLVHGWYERELRADAHRHRHRRPGPGGLVTTTLTDDQVLRRRLPSSTRPNGPAPRARQTTSVYPDMTMDDAYRVQNGLARPQSQPGARRSSATKSGSRPAPCRPP